MAERGGARWNDARRGMSPFTGPSSADGMARRQCGERMPVASDASRSARRCGAEQERATDAQAQP